MELLKRQKESTEGHEGGGQIGGEFPGSARARELYKKTKERLSDAKQRFSNKMSETGSKMKDSIFSNSLIGAVCSFFILRFIYILYENLIDSNGRWVKLKFNQKNILGVSISQNLGEDGDFIPITTEFVQGSIKEKRKELQQESKKQEGEVEVAEDVGEEPSELSSTSSQPDSPPTEPTPSSPESEPPQAPEQPPQAPDAAFSEAQDVAEITKQTSSGTQDQEVNQAVQAAQGNLVNEARREEIRRRCIERRKCNSPRTVRKQACRNKCNEEAFNAV